MWQPITDLSDDPASLTDGELDALGRVWAKQKEELAELGTLDEFDKRLRREWSIETGIIEGVYTLDRGTTNTLIERGINADLIPRESTNRDPELVARILQDHYEALEGMFDFVKGERELTTGYVKQLHAALLRNQETYTVVDQFGQAFEKQLDKGLYKSAPNNPTKPDRSIHEYRPPEHVASEMDRLISMYQQTRNVPVEVSAAWLHHRFAQIHPFPDGNGRVARALATLVFIKAGWFPLMVKRDGRARYIDGLEDADQGDLRPLVSFFTEVQRNAVIQATEVASDMSIAEAARGARSPSSVQEAIIAARDRLFHGGRLSQSERLRAQDTADKLNRLAMERLGQVVTQLREEIAKVSMGISFDVRSGGSPENVRAKAIGKAGHNANFRDYSVVVQLLLKTDRQDSLSFSFHALGPGYRGIIGVVAYSELQSKDTSPLEGGTFQINYEESPDKAVSRFTPWLERMITLGLDEWRRSL